MATLSCFSLEESITSARATLSSISAICFSRFQSSSRATSNSAFSERSPISRAAPRAFSTRGSSTFLRRSSFLWACSYPSGVMGMRSSGLILGDFTLPAPYRQLFADETGGPSPR